MASSLFFCCSTEIGEKKSGTLSVKGCVEVRMTTSVCEVTQCCSCFACVNVCSKKGVTLAENERGELRPRIDETACVHCGACRMVCPVNTPVARNRPKKAFAAWSLDSADRLTSSSGGAASVFAAWTVKRGGVVYAVAYQNGVFQHLRVDSPGDLPKLKGSKYVGAFVLDAMRSVRDDLKSGRPVLFVGTPCQVAGIRNFLGRSPENLFLVDLICHGTPPQALFRDYLKETTKEAIYDKINFRARNGYVLELYREEKRVYHKKLYAIYPDLYYVGFMSSLFFSENCYVCPYANLLRVGDVTIGDFMGLGEKEPFRHSKKGGVSALLVNTAQGKTLIESCSDSLFLEERSVQEVYEGQSQLKGPPKKSPEHDEFIRLRQTRTVIDSIKLSAPRTIRAFRIIGWCHKLPFYAILKKITNFSLKLFRKTDDRPMPR